MNTPHSIVIIITHSALHTPTQMSNRWHVKKSQSCATTLQHSRDSCYEPCCPGMPQTPVM